MQIAGDDRAGALVLTALRQQLELLRRLIARIDRPKPQVLIEVAIVEFTPSDTLSLGIELQTLDQVAPGQNRGFAASSFGLSSLVDQAGRPIAPGAAGLPQGRVPIPGTGAGAALIRGTPTSLPILLRALQVRNKTNVLSLPRILAIEGVPAEIKVADEAPVTQTNALNAATTTTSFQQFVPDRHVPKFTAQVARDRTITLAVEQKVEAFVGSAPAPGVPPAKTSRSLKTDVRVPDGRIVILGGFAQAREVRTVEQVPLLGDIPLLGLLFRSTVRSVSKTYLYIFVRPRIIGPDEMGKLQQASDELRREQKAVVPPLHIEGKGR